MSNSERIRKEVSDAYGRAITQGSGCCGSSATPVPVSLTRYDSAELKTLPPEVVSSSFGCGNPVAFTGLKEGDVVLDLGSGAGIDLLLARQRVGGSGRVIGVDMTDAMIDRARASIARLGHDNVEVRKGIIEDLPVDSESVDWVISNCVINLSPEKARVFAEIARVLRPGGSMLVSDLVVSDLPGEARTSLELYTACVGGAIPESQYLEELRAAGLVDVCVRERIVYDAAALADLLGCGDSAPANRHAGEAETASLVQLLAGKVASVRVYGRKP